MEQAVQALPSGGAAGGFDYANGVFPVELVRGKRIVFSAWIKTERVTNGWAGIVWSAHSPDKKLTAFNNLQSMGPRGTKGWKRYEIALDVPADTDHVGLGMLMPGQGKAWFDDLQLMIDGVPCEPGEKFGFDFEGQQITGFRLMSNEAYRVSLSNEAHRGKQALKIESLERKEQSASLSQALTLWQECEARIHSLPLLGEAAPNPDERAWVERNVRIVIQALENKLGVTKRDRSMAENVLWLVEQNSGQKIILWAHNGHIAMKSDAMGGMLRDALGDQFRVLGFATGRGTYRAAAANGSGHGVFPLAEPDPTSVEAVCDHTGLPRFVLDLRPTRKAKDAGAAWFSKRHLHRMIGSGEMTNQYIQKNVGAEYDLMIWLADSQAAVPLGEEKKK